MGITKVVLVPTAVLMGCWWGVKDSKRIPVGVRGMLLHASAVGAAAAVCSHPSINHTGLFGKGKAGLIPLWSRLLFFPYLYSLQAYVKLRRLKNREEVFTEVAEGLFVGGWPCHAQDVPPNSPAVVDCTCELPRPPCLRALPHYLNIPTWDSRGPRPAHLQLAVQWALARRAEGHPVFVHCAFGHGRSVAVICAILVALGTAESWREAEHIIKQLRPRIRLNKGQVASLQHWTDNLSSAS